MDLQEKLNEIDKELLELVESIKNAEAKIKQLHKQRKLIEKAKALETGQEK